MSRAARILEAASPSVRKLEKAIQSILKKMAKEYQCDLCFKEPETIIYTGQDAVRQSGIQGIKLVLAFDGAGYDYLSMESDPRVSSKWRELLRKEAERLGFFMEAINNWSDGFYEE